MVKKVAIGVQDFSKLIERSLFYVDKTEFIKSWWESEDDITLITRPRRFGKTLTMSMLNCFFSVQYANRVDLFQNLNIWQYEEYRTIQGTYPVIFLSFAKANAGDFETVKGLIFSSLAELYSDNNFLLSSGILDNKEIKQFNAVDNEMNLDTAVNSVYFLSKYLSRYYNKKTIILLDEYDTPMITAYSNDYWEELTKFMRSFFNATFKTNPYLEKGLMTGITRVAKESMFSGLNNLNVCTVTSPEYADVFGFTEKEVFAAMEKRGKNEEEKQEVKKYYDGFSFGDTKEIYNPWSIINYLAKGRLEPYWANTASNEMIEDIIQKSGIQFRCDLQCLISKESITKDIDENINFKSLYTDPNAAWSLLLAAGYLKADARNGKQYTLSLTNFEVRMTFEDVITAWISQGNTSYSEFIQALLAGNIEAMNTKLNAYALAVFSSFDTGRRQSEKFYHGFILGIATQIHNEYIISSNKESGEGRADVLLYRKDRTGDAIILEFKAINKKAGEKALSDTVTAALKQIEEKQYAVELHKHGFTDDRIREYGIAFSKKKCLVGGK